MITFDTRKIIIKILTSLLSFIFFFTFNINVLIYLARISINEDLIRDLLKFEYEENDIVIEDMVAVADDSIFVIDPSEFNENENTPPVSEDDIEKTIQNMLVEHNLPYDLYKYIENNDENMNLLSNIVQNAIDYSIGKTNDLSVSSEEITVLLSNAIDNYEKQTEIEIDRSGLDEFVESFVDYYENDMVSIDKSTINLFNSILYGKIFYFFIIINIIIVGIIIGINYNNIGFLLNIFIPTLITGATFILVPRFIKDSMKNANVIDSILNNSINLGSKITILSLIGIGLYILLRIVKKQREESEEYA